MDFHRAGRLAEAGVCYENALRGAPRNSDALHLLGVVLAAEGQVDRGIELIQRAIKIQPRFPAALFNLGNLLQKQKKLEAAVAAYKRALALQPQFAEAHCNLGNALVSLGRLDDAAVAFRGAVSADRDYAAAHHNLGLVLQRQGKLAEAGPAFRRAVALKPDFAHALCDLGTVLLAQNNFEEAIAVLRQAVDLNPQDGLAWRTLGASLRAAEKTDDAMAAYRQAIALLPGCVELLTQGKISDAISALQLAASANPLSRRSGPAPVIETVSVSNHATTVETIAARIEFAFSIIVLTGPTAVTVCAPAFFRIATGTAEPDALRQLDAAILRETGSGPIAGADGNHANAFPPGDVFASTKAPITHAIAEPPGLFYEFARALEEAHYFREALECLRRARRLGLKSKHFLFNHGRLSAFLGQLDEAGSLHEEASAACVREAALSVTFGSAELPAYLWQRKPIGRLADLLEESSSLGLTDGSQPLPPEPRLRQPPEATGPATDDIAARLLRIEAHNLLAEDLINFYGDFAGARAVYERRSRSQRECLDACQLDQADTLFLGMDWVRNVGHIAFLGQLIKLRELGLAPWRRIVVLAREPRIANLAYLNCWRKYLTVVTDPLLVDRFEPLVTACGFRFSTLFPFAGRDPLHTAEIGSAVEEQWDLAGRAPLLALSEAQDAAGWSSLATRGIDRKDGFVCLHVRETGFHGKSDHAPRNAAISSYFQAIETITRQGGWVIRMGDPSMSRLPAMDRVLDYAHSGLKAPEMDVFLCARGRCFIGTNSGLSHVPYTFGTPVVLTNWTIAGGLPPFPRHGIFLPKLIHSTAERRLLSFRELVTAEWRARSSTAATLEENEAHFVDNTPDEINEAVCEMLGRLNSPHQSLAGDDGLQEKFSALLPGNLSRGVTRVASGFLHRHAALL